MDDLVEWYVNQLDADERLVKEQRCINCDNTVVPIRSELGITGYTHGANEATPPGEGAWEGQRCPGSLMGAAPVQNPDRFLSEIDAKRKLLVVHRPVRRLDFIESDGSNAGPLVVCHECDANSTDADWPDPPCSTLRILAAPYDDRPGFKESWRP